MMWCVPVTQIVPPGLKMRHAPFSHLTLNRWSLSNPIDLIESLRPALRFRVPLEGDSVNELEVVR
jgi:hypothetical protein